MTGAPPTPGEPVPSELPMSVAQILGPDGEVAGTGFLVAEGLLVTCAHVVEAAGGGPGTEILLSFPHLADADEPTGTVLPDLWRSAQGEDVAFVRLSGTPAGARVLPLGSAEGRGGHKVRSFGFPAQAPPEGHLGFGEVGDLLPAVDGRGALLQLTNANDLTTGFSGGPVFDEVTGLVIGMLTEITAPDLYERGLAIAYATPTDALREILPELAEREVCPYRGLEPFTAEHARWFQGRSEAVRQVVANLARQRRLTLLLGPSGSGKSSLIQAGVLRELAEGELPGSDRWLPVVARPRQDMLAEIERAGLPGASRDGIPAAVNRRLAAEPEYHRVLLVIDQFEELLVQSTDGRLGRLLDAIDEVTSAADAYTKITLILIMRDDFYPQLAALAPKLLEAAMPGLLNVPGTLSHQDLHHIIVHPAKDVGLRFQPGLPEQIVSDVLETTPEASLTRQAPATALPLLEMTLKQLWERRHDGYLTHEAYRRIGGVNGSVATWCDDALDKMSAEQQDIARRALTSLVHPTDPSHNIKAVRSQVPLDELRDLAADPSRTGGQEVVDSVIAALARSRIITTQTQREPEGPDAPHGEPVAELIHEALIRDWGTLSDWIDEEHRFQDWLHRTKERQSRWAEMRDPGDLLGGTALAEGVELARKRRLPSDIAEFLAASRQRQRSSIRRSRVLNGVLGGVLALALLAMVGAVWEWVRVGNAKERALSREIAAESGELLGTDPELAALLAVKAYRTSRTSEAIDSLGSAAALAKHDRLSGHTDEVRAVAYSPDGRFFASAAADNTVRLRNATTMRTRSSFVAHDNALHAIAFHPERQILATAGADRVVRLWNPATGKHLRTLGGHTDQVRAVAFQPTGDVLATAGDDGTVRLWNPVTGKHLRTLRGHTGPVRAVAFRPENNVIATAGDDKTVRLWNPETGKHLTTVKGHTLPVTSVVFSPSGDTLATADGYEAHLRDPATGESPGALSDTASLIAFSPDGETFATATDRFVQLWDTDTRAPRATFAGHANNVLGLGFSPDSKSLATAGRDTTVRLWNARAGRDRSTLRGHTTSVYWLAFSPDGKTIASASADSTARLWDAATGSPDKELAEHSGEVNTVAFHPDGDMVATGSDDESLRLWDTETGISQPPLTDHGSPVRAAAFSPDGKNLATGGEDGTVLLRNADTGRARGRPVDAHSDIVFDMTFSPDSRVLATAGADSTAKLWDRNGQLLNTLTGHNAAVISVAFSPDGGTVATASSDGTVRLWNAANGRSIAALTEHSGAVLAVAFHPDGDLLATGSEDGTVRLWDRDSGKPRRTLLGSLSGVNHVTFSPDGSRLATAGVDGTGRLWEDIATSPEPETIMEQICRTFHRDLTPQERQAYLHDEDSDASVCR
ncbi:trypsin-like peptidase domain-containing protein [Streptomyces cinnabarinus]|uniref:Trypsin-like peptidase domain-containing protein n=1 Tax=Streptomyces cinnabarinus TaxID=67287 RepID=A0ABY7KBQ0_9ACTN|nr:trypsin-like peptidase domain-containing protein [Streptomyces cinnabarinus]WAZ21913.1 trypsin-like peptidase domain-containing protein [Streptomyces cinnabarinus]